MDITNDKDLRADFRRPRVDIPEQRDAELANLVDQIQALTDKFNAFVEYVNGKLAAIP